MKPRLSALMLFLALPAIAGAPQIYDSSFAVQIELRPGLAAVAG